MSSRSTRITFRLNEAVAIEKILLDHLSAIPDRQRGREVVWMLALAHLLLKQGGATSLDCMIDTLRNGGGEIVPSGIKSDANRQQPTPRMQSKKIEGGDHSSVDMKANPSSPRISKAARFRALQGY